MKAATALRFPRYAFSLAVIVSCGIDINAMAQSQVDVFVLPIAVPGLSNAQGSMTKPSTPSIDVTVSTVAPAMARPRDEGIVPVPPPQTRPSAPAAPSAQ